MLDYDTNKSKEHQVTVFELLLQILRTRVCFRFLKLKILILLGSGVVSEENEEKIAGIKSGMKS